MGPRAPPLDPPLDYSFESSKNDRHKSSLTGADQYLLPRTAFIKERRSALCGIETIKNGSK